MSKLFLENLPLEGVTLLWLRAQRAIAAVVSTTGRTRLRVSRLGELGRVPKLLQIFQLLLHLPNLKCLFGNQRLEIRHGIAEIKNTIVCHILVAIDLVLDTRLLVLQATDQAVVRGSVPHVGSHLSCSRCLSRP
jgi:hypothetical protein